MPNNFESAAVESISPSLETPQPKESAPAPSALETPLTSHAPSETDSTQPTTPSSAVTPILPRRQNQAAPEQGHKAHPSITVVPAVPRISLPSRPVERASISITTDTIGSVPPSNADHLTNAVQMAAHADQDNASNNSDQIATPTSSPIKTAPKSWADLVRTKPSTAPSGTKTLEGNAQRANGFQYPKPASLVEVLRTYDNNTDNNRVAFIEPRGLVNTGNMCYMNSVSFSVTFNRCDSSLMWARFFKY